LDCKLQWHRAFSNDILLPTRQVFAQINPKAINCHGFGHGTLIAKVLPGKTMHYMKKRLLVITSLVIASGKLLADTPIQLSLVPYITLLPRTETVKGFSLGIWSENPQSSLTLGFINGSSGESSGLSIGAVNYAESYTGIQWGIVNLSTANFVGWQNGWVNVAQGTFTGFQLAFVNVSENTTGVQAGWLNYAQELKGVQLGLINVAMNNPPFREIPDKLAPVFPFLNWSF